MKIFAILLTLEAIFQFFFCNFSTGRMQNNFVHSVHQFGRTERDKNKVLKCEGIRIFILSTAVNNKLQQIQHYEMTE